jgi:hypothetical protein
MAYEEGGVTMDKKHVDYLDVVDPYDDDEQPGLVERIYYYIVFAILALIEMVRGHEQR